jgi:hypothetical protein
LILKIGWKKIVLTAIVITALFVSGCSGIGGNAAPTPTPAPQASGNPTPAPAWNAYDSPAKTGQLYDLSRLNWYEFRFDSASDIAHSSGQYRFEFDDATYEGMPTRHTRVTYIDRIHSNASSPDSIIDSYASKANGSILGGHAKMYSAGQVTMDQDMTGSQIIGLMNRGYAYIAMLDRDSLLTAGGSYIIDLNGKQYTCTKYNYTVDGILRTAWYTPQAPAPLTVTWTIAEEKPVSVTVALKGWG